MVDVVANGPTDASLYVLGEAPGRCESCECEHSYHRAPQPFVGPSGHLLNQLLERVHLSRDAVRVGNVALTRPPNNEIAAFFGKGEGSRMVLGRWAKPPLLRGMQALYADLRRVRPNMVVALGNAALWALTGKWGVSHWRGSELSTCDDVSKLLGRQLKVVPTYHPAYVLRTWEYVTLVQADIRRASRQAATPDYPPDEHFFITRPSYERALAYVQAIAHRLAVASQPLPMAVDLETFHGHIECVGIAVSARDAICIPFLNDGGAAYWPLEHEQRLWLWLRHVLTHPRAAVIGQNFNYDAQYFARNLGFVPQLRHDTMVMQSVAFPGMLGSLKLTASGEAKEKKTKSKSLDFLASLHCRRYVQWKLDDIPYNTVHKDYDRYWRYACADVCATFEVAESLLRTLDHMGLREQYRFQMKLWWSALKLTLRGIRVDVAEKQRIEQKLEVAQAQVAIRLEKLVPPDVLPRGKTPWYQSPKQTMQLFYEVLGQQPVLRDRKKKDGTRTRTPSADDEALELVGKREPLVKPLTDALLQYRSLGTQHSDLVDTEVDRDYRVRSSWDIASVETLRLASRKNGFGGGRNLQNLTKVEE